MISPPNLCLFPEMWYFMRIFFLSTLLLFLMSLLISFLIWCYMSFSLSHHLHLLLNLHLVCSPIQMKDSLSRPILLLIFQFMLLFVNLLVLFFLLVFKITIATCWLIIPFPQSIPHILCNIILPIQNFFLLTTPSFLLYLPILSLDSIIKLSNLLI